MERLLKEKTCIVTGAARGIGKAAAQKYAEHGANLVLTDLNEEDLTRVASELEKKGVNVLPIALDVTNSSELKKAVNLIERRFGQIDILANCAGIVTSKLIIDIEEEEWDRVFNVNLKSVFLLSKYVAKNMT